MPRLERGPHGLKADPSARADDQDCRHGVILPLGPAWLTVMCDAGSCTARWAGGLKRVSKAVALHNRIQSPFYGRIIRLDPILLNPLITNRNRRALGDGWQRPSKGRRRRPLR